MKGGRRFWELTQQQVIPIFLLVKTTHKIGQIINNLQKLPQIWSFNFKLMNLKNSERIQYTLYKIDLHQFTHDPSCFVLNESLTDYLVKAYTSEHNLSKGLTENPTAIGIYQLSTGVPGWQL